MHIHLLGARLSVPSFVAAAFLDYSGSPITNVGDKRRGQALVKARDRPHAAGVFSSRLPPSVIRALLFLSSFKSAIKERWNNNAVIIRHHASGSPKRLHELLIFNTRVVFSPSFHHQAQHNKI